MADTPILQMKLTSTNTVTNMNESISWSYKSKFEKDYVISSTDSAKYLPITDFGNIRLLICKGTDNFDITITNKDPVADTVIFGVNDIFILSLTQASLATIDSITISTTAQSDMTVSVRIYEEV